jgi:hypothetical protein
VRIVFPEGVDPHCHWSAGPSAQEAEQQEENDQAEGHAGSHRMRGMRVDGRIEKAPAQASVPGEAKAELENDFASAANAQTQAPQSSPNTRVPATAGAARGSASRFGRAAITGNDATQPPPQAMIVPKGQPVVAPK